MSLADGRSTGRVLSGSRSRSVDAGCIGVARFVHLAIPVAYVQPRANDVSARAPHGTRKSRAPLAEARISVLSLLDLIVDAGGTGSVPADSIDRSAGGLPVPRPTAREERRCSRDS